MNPYTRIDTYRHFLDTTPHHPPHPHTHSHTHTHTALTHLTHTPHTHTSHTPHSHTALTHLTHTSYTPHSHSSHRHSLSGEVINFIHKTGCIMFSVRNIKTCTETQPPLEVVEMFSTLFCCLKDSADFSQVHVMTTV